MAGTGSIRSSNRYFLTASCESLMIHPHVEELQRICVRLCLKTPQGRHRSRPQQVAAVHRFIGIEAHRLAKLRGKQYPSEEELIEAKDSARWIVRHTIEAIQLTD